MHCRQKIKGLLLLLLLLCNCTLKKKKKGKKKNIALTSKKAKCKTFTVETRLRKGDSFIATISSHSEYSDRNAGSTTVDDNASRKREREGKRKKYL